MRRFKLALVAAVMTAGLFGAAGTAQADPPWGHDGWGHDGWQHQQWRRDEGQRWNRDRWRGDDDDRGGWGGQQVYVQPPGYYAPPPGYYAPPPPAYYAPPPVYYAPPNLSLGLSFPLH